MRKIRAAFEKMPPISCSRYWPTPSRGSRALDKKTRKSRPERSFLNRTTDYATLLCESKASRTRAVSLEQNKTLESGKVRVSMPPKTVVKLESKPSSPKAVVALGEKRPLQNRERAPRIKRKRTETAASSPPRFSDSNRAPQAEIEAKFQKRPARNLLQ